MPLRTFPVVTVLVFAVACGGDSAGAEAFCDAARDVTTIEPGDMEKTLETFERMRDEAPAEIEDAMNVLADGAAEAAESGDTSVIESQEFQDASDELDEYLEGNCEPPEDQ